MIVSVRMGEAKIFFYLKRHSDFSAFYQVVVENTYSLLKSTISKGDVVVDAGANCGMFTLLASNLVGNNGKVIAIEPDPQNLDILKINLKLNSIKNVTVITKALYSKNAATLGFHQDGVMSKLVNSKKEATTSVETITLDTIVDELNLIPTKLKMDIEGAEKYALLGMASSIGNINNFEAEIHSSEDLNVLNQICSKFDFKEEKVENFNSVINFSLKHPVKILKMEAYNHFLTTKRVLSLRARRFADENVLSFPRIIYGVNASNSTIS